MKKMLLAVLPILAVLSGCTVLPPGDYRVDAYDVLGKRVGVETTVPWYKVDGYKDVYCIVDSNSTVTVTSVETGELLKSASRLCSAASPIIMQSTRRPDPAKIFTFNGKTYSLTYKSKPSLFMNRFEFKADDEAPENWETIFVAIYFAVNPELTPQKYQKIQESRLSENKNILNYKLIRKGGVLYSFVTNKPSASNDSKQLKYTESVTKTFFQSSCDGFVTLEFVKRYPTDTPDISKTITNELDGIMTKLDEFKWEPSCKPVVGNKLVQ